MNTGYTFMIKTLLRPNCLQALLNSLRVHYPAADVVVTDDTPDPAVAEINRGYCQFADAEYIRLPEEVGASYAYNLMLDHIQSPYVVYLDDDFIVTPQTELLFWLPWLDAGIFDVLGGFVYNDKTEHWHKNFIGNLRITEGVLHLDRFPVDRLGDVAGVDIFPNFFIARREAIRWDADLKVCRHEDFFLRCKQRELKVGICKHVSILHRPERNPEYMAFRSDRFEQYKELFLKKWNLRGFGRSRNMP